MTRIIDPYNLPHDRAVAAARMASDDRLAGYAQGRRRGAELANMDYQLYLKTPEWQATRDLALDRAGGLCEHCGSPTQLQVHHLTYDRRGCERAEDLAAICDHCHETTHGMTLIAKLSEHLGIERIIKTLPPEEPPRVVVDIAGRVALEARAAACGKCEHGWLAETNERCPCRDQP